ncbi:hypothetical protein J4Q44_G00337190 [Coregonus suidteri]|uniref:C2H2-type domain-containing protein n=1 Tax=Coregonus suidteri TaxID=861788 RepID=A0AAN8L078_9TELE
MENKKSLSGACQWTPEEIVALLTRWADGSVQEQLLSAVRNERVFTKLSSELAALGFIKTSTQCRWKIKKLKQEYKKIKDKKNKNAAACHGRWFAIMESVLGHQPSTLLESGLVIHSPNILESKPDSPPEEEGPDKSPSSWMPDEVQGLFSHRSGSGGINSASRLLESADSPQKAEDYDESPFRWTPEEVHALLTLWADRSVQEQLLSAVRNERVFTKLSSELASLGFNRSSKRCREKIKKLKQEYHKIKDDKKKRSYNRRRERWFAIMDSVLCHQPSTLVIDSDGKTLESTQPDSPQEVEDSYKSPSSLTSDEVHGFLGHRLGTSAAMINSPAMRLELTDSPLEAEHNDESRAIWSPEEVHALLTLWADGSVQEQLLSAVRNKRVFTKLSSELAALGSTKTSKQCREKIKKLKQEYKKIKNHTSKNSSNISGRRWFSIMDAVLSQRTRTSMLLESTQLKSLPEAEDSGPHLTLSSLRLLAPPLRLMSAFLWQVAQQHLVKHYGKLEEFVTLVTEMVPELLSSRQRTQLLLGLRARLVLELCRNDSTADLVTIQPHLDKIHYLTEFSVHKESNDDELEATESNFVELVQTLLEDPSEREHFFQEVFPVHYGPRYDTALQVLVWEFLSRLEELLPVPDFTQTAAWLGAGPSVMEECGHAIFDPEELKTLLQHHQHHGNLKKSYFSYYTADTILSTLSLPPTIRVVIGSEQASSDKTRDGGQPNGGRVEDEEEEEMEDRQSDEDCNEISYTRQDLEQQEQMGISTAETSALCIPVPSNGLNSDMSSQVLACSLCPFSHSEIAKLHQHIRIRHRGEDRKLLCCLVDSKVNEMATNGASCEQPQKRGTKDKQNGHFADSAEWTLKLWRQRGTVFLFLVLCSLFSLAYSTEGAHQKYVQYLEKRFLWCAYWVGLGILSSVGLGTGLHTFLLYLGPHIASVTLAAYECGSTDFPEPPYPDQIICPEGGGMEGSISLWSIVSKVRLEACMWGAGTAIGELPPYFMARAARLSGADPDDEDYEEFEEMLEQAETAQDFVTRAKLGVQNMVQKVGFFGILACASIPNPLFDLAGITCGHFLVPFWTFFGATLIGKAIVKMHIQKLFVIITFSKHIVEQMVSLIGSLPRVGPSIQKPFSEYLEAQRSKLHHHTGEGTPASENWLSWVFEKVVLVMVCYFIFSIINSMAQSYAKRRQQSQQQRYSEKKTK